MRVLNMDTIGLINNIEGKSKHDYKFILVMMNNFTWLWRYNIFVA